jgi:hypothetical protein
LSGKDFGQGDRVGDLLLTQDGKIVPVEEVESSGKIETVYNFRVADYHTYFVSATEDGASVWAHNYPTEGGESQKTGRQQIEDIKARLAKGGLSQKERLKLANQLNYMEKQHPPQIPLTGGFGHGTSRPKDTGTPFSVYTYIDPKTGKAVQNTIYGEGGRKIAQVDFENHGGGATSGHGHYFGNSGNEFFGHHASGAPHVDNLNLPTSWDRLPPGIEPHTPIGM